MARLRQQRDASGAGGGFGFLGANGKGGPTGSDGSENAKDESPSTARRGDDDEEEEEDDMYGENQVRFTWVYSKHVEKEKEKEEKDRLKTMPAHAATTAAASAAGNVEAAASPVASKNPTFLQNLKPDDSSLRVSQADGNVLSNNHNNINNDEVDSLATFDGDMGRRRSSISIQSSSPGGGATPKSRKNSSSVPMTTISESNKENDACKRKRGR